MGKCVVLHMCQCVLVETVCFFLLRSGVQGSNDFRPEGARVLAPALAQITGLRELVLVRLQVEC